MRLPRDVRGADLQRALRRLGYHPTRQRGSRVRMTTPVNFAAGASGSSSIIWAGKPGARTLVPVASSQRRTTFGDHSRGP